MNQSRSCGNNAKPRLKAAVAATAERCGNGDREWRRQQSALRPCAAKNSVCIGIRLYMYIYIYMALSILVQRVLGGSKTMYQARVCW